MNATTPVPTRQARGSFVADVPLALWFLLIGMAFPLLNLATITLRSTFLSTAARDAAHGAAKAKTFQTPLAPDQPSAKEVASARAQEAAAAFSEVRVTAIDTTIVYTDLDTGQTFRTSSPLTEPADTGQYVYNIEVRVSGQVEPLVTLPRTFFGDVPGLTTPIVSTPVARAFCEYPQGLGQ